MMKFSLYLPSKPGNKIISHPPFAHLGIAEEAEKKGAKSLIVSQPRTTAEGIDKLRASKPDLLGISTLYQAEVFPIEIEVAAALRKAGTKIVLGGQDVSSCEERLDWAIEKMQPDYVVLNEGETPIAELITAGLDPEKIDPLKVKTTKQGETWILQTHPRARYQLDQLPLPTQMPKIYPSRTGWLQGIIEIVRGCIGECNFCGGAKMPLAYMAPITVIHHLKAWLSLGVREIDLMGPDLTANPKTATAIVTEINKHPELGPLSFFFSVRVDTMAKALDHDPAAWLQFLANHQVTMELGIETFFERKLQADWLNKSRDPSQHLANIKKILRFVGRANQLKKGQPASTVAGDYITFDPWTSLGIAHYDYATQLSLAKDFPHLTITESSWAREMMVFPGTHTAKLFGTKRPGPLSPRYVLKGYHDKRADALRTTIRQHNHHFEPKKNQPIARYLERICALASSFQRTFRDPKKPVNLSRADSLVSVLESNFHNLRSFLDHPVI